MSISLFLRFYGILLNKISATLHWIGTFDIIWTNLCLNISSVTLCSCICLPNHFDRESKSQTLLNILLRIIKKKTRDFQTISLFTDYRFGYIGEFFKTFMKKVFYNLLTAIIKVCVIFRSLNIKAQFVPVFLYTLKHLRHLRIFKTQLKI